MPLFEEYDRRFLLLTYELLAHMKTPSEGTTDAEMLSLIAAAFRDKMSVPAKLELPPPRGRGGKPASLYSTPRIGLSAPRRTIEPAGRGANEGIRSNISGHRGAGRGIRVANLLVEQARLGAQRLRLAHNKMPPRFLPPPQT
jgi:hypothetical protein